MGERFSTKRSLLPVLIAAGFALFQTAGRSQDAVRGSDHAAFQRSPLPRPDTRGEDPGLRRLGALLRHFRSIGDLENASRIFNELFPAETAADPGSALKSTTATAANRLQDGVGNIKEALTGTGTISVFYSPEDEKNPAADTWRSSEGRWAIFAAAEQWAGGQPGAIRVRKSSDGGRTWPDSLVVGDGRAWTHPSLRQVGEDTIGMAFVKDWDAADRDIYFARLSPDLKEEDESPVALSRADQSEPDLATDLPSYPAPYVYIVYAEREGPAASIRFRVSADLGATWSRPVTVGSFPAAGGMAVETAIAFDAGPDALHIAFSCPQGPASGIAVATSTNFGASWSRPVFVTPPDDRPDSSPRIAAREGTALVVYDHETAGAGRDIGSATSSDAGRSWRSSGPLASSAAAERSPDVCVADGEGAPKFFASYVEEDTRVLVLGREAAGDGSWTTEATFEAGAATIGTGPAVVVPMPGPDDEVSAGVFWAHRNPDYDVSFGRARLAAADGVLSVTPAEGLTASGPIGGPFSPDRISYTLRNAGDSALTWATEHGAAWVTLSGSGGTLGPGESATVEVAFNEAAIDLPMDIHSDVVKFTNTTNGEGTATRDVTLSLSLATLSVTPDNQDVPSAAGTTTFAVVKGGPGRVDWIATVTSGQSWLAIQSGAVGSNSGTIVAVFLENTDPSQREGSIRVTPTNISLPSVTVTVTQAGAPVLDVTPADGLTSAGPQGGPFSPSSKDYTLQNSGGSALAWTVASAGTWMAISPASGTLEAGDSTTVTVSIAGAAATLAAGSYNESVSFTNTTNGVGTTTRPCSLTVEPGPGVLSVTPIAGLTSTGPAGGPFAPSSQAYTLRNTGGISIDWTAAKNEAWTTLSETSGTLASGASATVTVSINGAANALAAGGYNDTVTFTNTTNGTGTTSRAVALTVTAEPGALSVTPTAGLASTGPVGGPFTPSSRAYTLQNTGGTSIDWTAAKNEAWTALSAASGTLAPGDTATVTVSINAAANALAAGGYSDTVSFTNTTNGNGNTSRSVSLTVTAVPGALSVTPTAGLTSAGPVGGPFTPSSQAYTLQNTGGASINWTAAKNETWTTVSTASGTLAPGDTATVTVSINAAANALAPGGYGDTVSFTNTTTGNGNTSRAVALTVTAPPGALSVTPTAGLASTGPAGGPFTPSSQAYTLHNTGGTSINWTAAKNETWTTVSAASGTLGAGATATVTVSINTWANALAGGTYTDSVTFTNTTNGTGNTSRSVSLTVSVVPALSVAPANRDVAFPAGTTTFSVSNTGGGTLNWTASVLSGGDWLSIQSGGSGSGAGTITAAFSSNRAAAPRVGIIRVNAAGASGSPKDVTVTQSWGSITLGLGGQRLLEKAWIIQREYGKLTVSVGNPAIVPIESYIIYRKTGQHDYQVLQEVPGSAVNGTQWIYNDTFLEPGTSYTYKVAAVDILGGVIAESNEITI